jgi:hypothetical protein
MKEVGVVLGANNKPIYWHVPDSTPGAIPDSRELWLFLIEHKDEVTGFAHTHPGKGYPAPSYTDSTTFKSIELGLGKQLNWFILSEDKQVLCLREYGQLLVININEDTDIISDINKSWMKTLRELSEY